MGCVIMGNGQEVEVLDMDHDEDADEEDEEDEGDNGMEGLEDD